MNSIGNKCPGALGVAAVLGVALLPAFQASSSLLTIACSIGTAIILAASFHVMFGLCGMLWFAQAVFSGIGGYVTVYLLTGFKVGAVTYFPVAALPLIGGIAAATFALVIGWVVTSRERLAFSMVSLGIAELVIGVGYVFGSVTGGEEGLTAERWVGPEPLGITFGPQWQMYGLVLAWVTIVLVAVRFFETTPLGRIARAVRDNPVRVGFSGYNVRVVRWLVFSISAFLAGIAGALQALNYEQIGLSALGIDQSALPLLMIVIGGVGSLTGAVAGAVVVTLLYAYLAVLTPAWLLYVGLLFTLMLIYAPKGLSGAFSSHRPLLRSPRVWRSLGRPYAIAVSALLLTMISVVGVIESIVRLHGHQAIESPMAGLMLGLFLLLTAVGMFWAAGAVSAARGEFNRMLVAQVLSETAQ